MSYDMLILLFLKCCFNEPLRYCFNESHRSRRPRASQEDYKCSEYPTLCSRTHVGCRLQEALYDTYGVWCMSNVACPLFEPVKRSKKLLGEINCHLRKPGTLSSDRTGTVLSYRQYFLMQNPETTRRGIRIYDIFSDKEAIQSILDRLEMRNTFICHTVVW